MKELTHLDASNNIHMVDVGKKDVTERTAVASGRIRGNITTIQKIKQGDVTKGNVLTTARLAGIMAAKRTGELIPLCHVLPLENVTIAIDFEDDNTIFIRARVTTTAKTGVEMEALVAVSITALTVYDMCKSIDKTMVVENIQLEEKSGGKSGEFKR